MSRRLIRLDHWALRDSGRACSEFTLYWGTGWNAVHANLWRHAGRLWVRVWRERTGHLLAVDSIDESLLSSMPRDSQVRWINMAVSRVQSAAAGGGDGKKVVDPDFARKFPLLSSLLTDEAFEDGELRVGATFTVFVDPDGWKMCLNERDQSLTLWSAGTGHEAMLEACEAQLASDNVPWRRSSKVAAGGGKESTGKSLPRSRRRNKK